MGDTPILAPGSEHRLPRPPDAATALLAWAMAAGGQRFVLAIAEGPLALARWRRDVTALGAALPPAETATPPAVLTLPAEEPAPGGGVDPELAGARLETLLHLGDALRSARPVLLLTTIQALLQPAPLPTRLESVALEWAPGDAADPHALAKRLQAIGYTPVPEVQAKGQMALRGGLVDVWPVNGAWPVRIECFDDRVETIRVFDPESQRSREKPRRVRVAPVYAADTGAAGEWLQVLPTDTLVIWSDAEAIAEHAGEARDSPPALPSDAPPWRAGLRFPPTAVHWHFETAPPLGGPGFDFIPMPPVFAPAPNDLNPDARTQDRQRRWSAIRADLDQGHRVLLFFDTPGARQHFESDPPAHAQELHLHVGALSDGFRSVSLGLVVLAECNWYGLRKIRAADADALAPPSGGPAKRDTGDRIADLNLLRPGDLVVHVEHGLGRYLGVQNIETEGRQQEVVTVEYAEGARLHVPVAHAHLLSRYVGVSRAQPALHRLGGRRWTREKQDAERAIADLAAELLETQAHRHLLDGFAFPEDTPWQREFEASFPFEETPDQVQAILDVKTDMQARRPMDRLICGDAGYGKTEVAMRAAFKAMTAGRQVAVLVPTTVLAQQHFQTFCERMAPYPFRIEVLSRFTRGRHAAILAGLVDGTVDLAIGTHALVQPGVGFRDLGLVIVDEEQRFGVAHKERLKRLRRMVDVLTLSATPIPRTLHLSLTGARDMSLLQTPPRLRMAIDTDVARDTDAVVQSAIRRELAREGQVYYLYNRVMTIERARRRLQALVPEARIAVGHGQMAAGELKAVMRGFSAGEFDVLLCTTIIESGLDIPRANTILIDRADRFGIADLYQLRGRVGRSPRKAYALLLIPAHGSLDADARQRIDALQRHSALGAGFGLALRDLEIRGAGNLLGAQQSGHIAAVGFGLYCQLLRRTTARLKGETPPDIVEVDVQVDFLELSPSPADPDAAACLPAEYLPAEGARLEWYRRLAQTATPGELDNLRAELRDRYGPPPPAVTRLFLLHAIKLAAHVQGIRIVRVRDDKLMLTRRGDVLMDGQKFPRLRAGPADARLKEMLKRIHTCSRWAD